MLIALGVGKPRDGKSRGKPGPMMLGKEDDESADDGAKEGKLAAARTLASAVKSGDDEAIADAFQDMYDLCAASAGSAESDEDEDY
jgi:hypothetical protein